MSNRPLRWGFMGSGKIACDFANCLRYLPSDEHQIIAVAASKLDKAQDFAKRYSVEKYYEGYEKVANCPEVDVVYVNVIHPYHFACAKLALEAGKAVLCEKPMGTKLSEIKDLIKIAKEKNVFLMEGFWSRCFPVYHELTKAVHGGELGKVQMVQATFGVKFDEDVDRLFKKELGGGTLLDIGCYTIQFASLIFKGERPEKICALGTMTHTGVDENNCILLKYKNGGLASLCFGGRMNMENRGTVYGTEGKAEIPTFFWCPNQLTVNDKKIDKPFPKIDAKFEFDHSEGFVYEAQHVRDCLLKGLKESPLINFEETVVIGEIVDEVKRQLGIE